LWHDAVDELVQMLEQCHTAMKQGALAIDEEVLHAIGCFNSQVSGSGTVAAAAAVFLASRFAADPKGGLLEAASAVGADTDTIASMTGALLGAVGGYEWLGELAGQVQDAHYLKAMAESIWRAECGASGEDISATRSVRESDLRRITCVLEKATPGMDFLLPDGRGAKLVESQSLTSRCGKNQIISWRVESTDGQTLYIKKMSRTRPTQMLPGEGQGEEHGKDGTRERTPSAHAARVWFRLLVRNLEASRAFYHEVLGLRIIDALPALINLEGAIALVPLEYEKELPAVGGTMAGLSRQGATILCLGVKSLDMKCKGVRDSGACIVTSISSKGGQRFFRCLDPDGNVVEVFEMK
jgi:predicted enzyme related to lactoylglutathione lyase